jgi:hypothetical protein
MNLPKPLIAALLVAPVLGAEFFCHWWMNPPKQKVSPPYPLFVAPVEQAEFKELPEVYNEVRGSLYCNQGWLGTLGDGNSPTIRLAWFEWDQASGTTTLEAFRHLPDQCMGAAGMKLEKINEPRVIGEDGKTLVFDSTLFRPPQGGATIFVFKTVWASGWSGVNLRKGLDGASSASMRSLRLSAAVNRFRPERTRVLMAAVTGFPTEELAWNWVKKQSLDRIRWSDDPAIRQP